MTVNPSVTCCPDQAVEVADLYGCVSRILANSTGISSSISECDVVGLPELSRLGQPCLGLMIELHETIHKGSDHI
jgi:hypothetical protein